jgi:hypothetical protein
MDEQREEEKKLAHSLKSLVLAFLRFDLDFLSPTTSGFALSGFFL